VTKHSLLTFTFSLDARKSFNSTSNPKVHEHITLFLKVLKFCHLNDSALTAVKKKSKQTMFFCLFVFVRFCSVSSSLLMQSSYGQYREIETLRDNPRKSAGGVTVKSHK
jgi:hypothetical protein